MFTRLRIAQASHPLSTRQEVGLPGTLGASHFDRKAFVSLTAANNFLKKYATDEVSVRAEPYQGVYQNNNSKIWKIFTPIGKGAALQEQLLQDWMKATGFKHNTQVPFNFTPGENVTELYTQCILVQSVVARQATPAHVQKYGDAAKGVMFVTHPANISDDRQSTGPTFTLDLRTTFTLTFGVSGVRQGLRFDALSVSAYLPKVAKPEAYGQQFVPNALYLTPQQVEKLS